MSGPEVRESSNGVHVMAVRVYYEDTDAAGVVYHANYLRFAERARTEMLRVAGVDQSAMWRDAGIGFAVRTCGIDFIAPARLDDELEVHTRVLAVGGASVRAEQVVRRNGDALARLNLRIACVRDDGRPARLPAAVRAALESFRQPRGGGR